MQWHERAQLHLSLVSRLSVGPSDALCLDLLGAKARGPAMVAWLQAAGCSECVAAPPPPHPPPPHPPPAPATARRRA